ncbi:MAG TPA: hypothetical protein VJY62_10990 [Bacteroidia bacterium]|nr:hypothetical protein [Bacteroidia bacterium]
MNLTISSPDLFRLCHRTADACRHSAFMLKKSEESLHFLECARQSELLMSMMMHNADIDYIKFEECAEICSHCALFCEQEDDLSYAECGNICRECEEFCNIMAERSINYYQTV